VPVARITFAVERAAKGVSGETVTIEILHGNGTAGQGLPGFAPGERAILFLYPPSRLGLTSPVGLGQGKFSLVRDKEGRELAINAFGNRTLLSNVSRETRARLATAHPLDLGAKELLDGVDALVRAKLVDARRPKP
jgi:hypothetical protein